MPEDELQKALAVLRGGGIVAYPTDTVYGLGADALNPEAVARVFQTKGRSQEMALPLLVADLDMLRAVVSDLSETAMALAQRFLPGPLTLVLPKALAVPDIVTAGGPTVAVRIPDHPIPRALAAGLGSPLVGTSANRSGLPSPTTAEGVRRQLGDEVDYVIEGTCPGGIESTVVDVAQTPPKILRHGAVPTEAVRAIVGDRICSETLTAEG